MSLSINGKDIDAFFGEITSRLPLYGPTLDKNEAFSKYRFKQVKRVKDLSLTYAQTVIPPKKYLFPARGDLLLFEKGTVFPPKNKDFVLVTNRRDGEGLFYLDEIMRRPVIDGDYEAKRKHMKLIVVDQQSPSNALNCDLYLQKTKDNCYIATPFTEFGESLVTNSLFGHKTDASFIAGRNMPDEVIFHPRLDEIVENSRNHPIWDELAEKCFNCGICSYVCPLCYCFEVEDKVKLTKDVATDVAGSREKIWDSCMLPDFGAVSFKNFRPGYKDRIYNWYHHKFVRMPRELGFPGCVDCGRCMHFCPAKINYRDVLKELIDAEKR